jgi:hypothetical protein
MDDLTALRPGGTRMKFRFQWLVCAAVVAAAIGLIALQAHWGWKDTRVRHAFADAKYPPVTEWTQPRTMATFGDADGNYWFLYAREMLTEGRWRIHWTHLDNTPFGRPVHWSSSYSWWMILLAKARAVVSGGTALDHLAWAADNSEAILHALFVVAFVAIFWRRAGAVKTAIGALLLATLEPLTTDLAFARPDHHGLHDGAVLAGLSCLACALWPDEKHRRGWILAASFFCAMGMWIGATAQFVILGAVALGGCVWPFVCPKGAAADEFAPLWRLWGWAGGGFALAFFALEYAPGPWPFRLEVNHPLFALAWIGLGEFTAHFQSARAAGRLFTPGVLVAGVAVAPLPLTILALPAALYSPRDPIVIALFRMGIETTPMWQTSMASKAAYFSLVAIALAGLLGARVAVRAGKLASVTIVPLAAGFLLLLFAAMQVRWAGLAAAAVLVTWMVPVPAWRFGWLQLVAAVAALACSGFSLWHLARESSDLGYSYANVDWQAARDLGLILRQSAAGRPLRIITDHTNANYVWLHDLAGAELVGSQYWECVDGLRDSTAFWLSTDDAVARAICQRRGVTHVVLKAKPGSVMTGAFMGEGNTDAAAVKRTLLYRLGGPKAAPPPWLEQVPLPRVKALVGVNNSRLFRVLP